EESVLTAADRIFGKQLVARLEVERLRRAAVELQRPRPEDMEELPVGNERRGAVRVALLVTRAAAAEDLMRRVAQLADDVAVQRHGLPHAYFVDADRRGGDEHQDPALRILARQILGLDVLLQERCILR